MKIAVLGVDLGKNCAAAASASMRSGQSFYAGEAGETRSSISSANYRRALSRWKLVAAPIISVGCSRRKGAPTRDARLDGHKEHPHHR